MAPPKTSIVGVAGASPSEPRSTALVPLALTLAALSPPRNFVDSIVVLLVGDALAQVAPKANKAAKVLRCAQGAICGRMDKKAGGDGDRSL